MRVMLTSCGLETEAIQRSFLDMMGKEPAEVKALFIPTAVLPKCIFLLDVPEQKA